MYRTRTYEPEEVRRILRRAAELQDAERLPPQGGRPLTLEEIQQLAREAGIDGGLVLQAATGGQAPAPAVPGGAKSNAFVGGPTRLTFERTVTGRVGPANHAQLVKLIRRTLGDAGNAQVLGDSLAWSTMAQWAQGGPSGLGRVVNVSIDPEPDGVSVRIDENLRNLSGGLFGGLLGGVGGGGLGVFIPLALAFFPVAGALGFATAAVLYGVWLIAIYLIARSLYASRLRARTAELSKLLDGLVDLIATEPAKLATRSRVAAAGARVEREPREESDAAAGEADEMEESEASAGQRGRRR